MFERRLKIGTFWGIGVYVHWTFSLLVGFVAYAAHSQGPYFVAFNVLLLLHVFLCVTLHEYGHSLTARRFGIPTVDITLLPIGGVARLHRMPRIPWQELVVAVAGPAVNVVIATVLATAIFAIQFDALSQIRPFELSPEFLDRLNMTLEEPTVFAFLLLLMVANIALILFNMIPAFPMDGGRVLRSVLAMLVDYRVATYIAFGVGVCCAIVLGTLALQYEFWTAGLVAVFVIIAGLNETKQVRLMETVRGFKVSDIMIREPQSISMNEPIGGLPELWRSVMTTSVPVVGVDRIVVGMLSMGQAEKYSRAKSGADLTVGDLVARNLSEPKREQSPKVRPHDSLEEVILSCAKSGRYLPVVDDAGGLVGLLDLDTATLRCRLAAAGSPTNA